MTRKSRPGKKPDRTGPAEPATVSAASCGAGIPYEALVEVAGDVVAVFSADLRVRYMNEAGAALFGKPRAEILGRDLSELFPAKLAADLKESLRRILAFGEPFHRERWLPLSGKHFYVHTRLSPWREAGGQVIGALIVARDITGRKRVEDALQLAQDRYHRLLSSVPAIVYSVDARIPAFEVLEGAVEQITGYSADDLLADYDLSSRMVWPSDKAAVTKQLEAGFKSRRPFQLQHRIQRRGEALPTWVWTHVVPELNEAGQLIRHHGVALDVTRQKQTESSLERLRQAIENAGEGIVVWDSDSRVAFANAAMQSLTGSETRETLIGRPWASLFGAQVPSAVQRMLEGKASEFQAWRGDLVCRRADGQVVPVHVTLTRVPGADQEVAAVSNIRDRTTEQAYFDELRDVARDANSTLEHERARLSRELHDVLGQSLTALVVSLGWIRRHLQSEDDVLRERVDFCYDTSAQMVETVRDLSGTLRPPALDHHGFADVLRTYVADFRKNTGIRCRVTIEPESLTVADPVATVAYRIMQEALTNVARHAAASACELLVRAEAAHLVMTIRDNGSGMDRGALTRRRGLGITGMRERAGSVGGSVEIISRKGGGVCVNVHLPLATDERNAARQSEC